MCVCVCVSGVRACAHVCYAYKQMYTGTDCGSRYSTDTQERAPFCLRVHVDGGRTCMLCESGSVCVVERRRPRLMRGMAAAGAAGSVAHLS